MLNIINKSQRNKLKLERMSSYSIEQQQYNPYNFDQPVSNSHRPVGLKLHTRRQSISVDNVQRQSISSNCSSPEINYLRVSCNLPLRRHSDNAIEPPRIILNQPNQTSTSSIHISNYNNYQSNSSVNATGLSVSANQIPRRRHSSVNPQEVNKGVSNAYNIFNQARNFAKVCVQINSTFIDHIDIIFNFFFLNLFNHRVQLQDLDQH